MLCLSAGDWTAEAGVYLLASDALGTGLSGRPRRSAVMVIANAAALIPAAPGIPGHLRRGGHPGGAARRALARRRGVGYLLLLRFLLFIPITVVGLAIYMWKYSGWQRLRRRTARPDRTLRRHEAADSHAPAGVTALDRGRRVAAPYAGSLGRRGGGTLIVGALRSRRCCAPTTCPARSGSTRGSRSASRRTRSPTFPGCCARTARRRCTTCCCTSGSDAFGPTSRRDPPAVAAVRAALDPGRRCGPGGACSAAARGWSRAHARRGQPRAERVRAGDAHVLAARVPGPGRRRPPISTSFAVPPPRRTWRCLVPGLTAMLYTHNWARSSAWARWPRSGRSLARSRGPAAGDHRRRDRLRRWRRCCTCRGCRPCSSRRPTPGRRGRRTRS